MTFLSLFFSLSFCPLPPPAHFSPLFGPHYSFRIPLFSIQSSSLLSLFAFSPPIVLPSSASLFCPPNGSHYSFRPCPSSIQSWSSLPPLFSIYAFPRPTLHPRPYVRSFLLGVIGAALPLSSSSPSLCPHATPFHFPPNLVVFAPS